MRTLIASLAALALSACAGMTPQQIAGTASSGLYAAATLAQVGTIDERLAPIVTRAEMIVMRTRLRLQNGVMIGPDAAAGVLARTDAAVSAIQSARTAPTAAQREQHIAAAQAALDDANQFAETAR